MSAATHPAILRLAEAFDLGEDRQVEPLTVACHMLVMRALEVLGKRILQRPRSRWNEFRGRAPEMAHTVYRADPEQVEAILATAWDHVPSLVAVYEPDAPRGAAAEVRTALDRVVREAVAEQTSVSIVRVSVALRAIVG